MKFSWALCMCVLVSLFRTCQHVEPWADHRSPCFIPNSSLLWRRLMNQITIPISFPLSDYIVYPRCAVDLPDTSCLHWPSGIPYLMKSQKLIRGAFIETTCPSKTRKSLLHGAERHRIAFPCFVLCSFRWKVACRESFWCHIFGFLFQVCSSKAYFEFLDLRLKSTILKIHLREVGVQDNCFSLFNSLGDVRKYYVFLTTVH